MIQFRTRSVAFAVASLASLHAFAQSTGPSNSSFYTTAGAAQTRPAAPQPQPGAQTPVVPGGDLTADATAQAPTPTPTPPPPVTIGIDGQPVTLAPRIVTLPNFPTQPANTLPPPPTNSIYVTQVAQPVVLPPAPKRSSVAFPEGAQAIRAQLASSTYLLPIGRAIVEPSVVTPLYSLRAYNPIFITAQGPNALVGQLKDLIFKQGVLSGLDPRDYWSNEIEARLGSQDLATLAQLDLLLTQSLVRFAADISVGRVSPAAVDSTISYTEPSTAYAKRKFTGFALLNAAINEGTQLGARIATLEPTHEQYRRLKTFLATLLQMKASGAGWAKLSAAKTIHPAANPGVDPDETSPDVPLLRDHMITLGYMDPSMASNSQAYDVDLVAAVKRWQTESKLGLDGIVGPMSFAAINLSLDARINQVRATMEKWRWMPSTLGSRYIFVNTAFQELNVYENGKSVLAMNVVNGQQMRPTPMFKSAIDSVVLNPFWSPPSNNILNDIMPAQRRDPEHMAKEHIQIFRTYTNPANGQQVTQLIDPKSVKWNKYLNVLPPFAFRQETGPDNSLGIVKFNLRNSNAIYLHDTVHRDLFPHVVRLESSGCIRLERPLDLLDYLLRAPGRAAGQPITPDLARTMMTQPDTYAATWVSIAQPIDVYVVYMTTWVDDFGQVRMADDRKFYGQDDRIVKAMSVITPGQL